MRLFVKEIVESVGGNVDTPFTSEKLIEGFSTDTRNLKKGELFIPLVGENFDGHSFIKVAENNGAAAAFWEISKPIPKDIHIPLILVEDTLIALQKLAGFYREKVNPIVIGVTGSNGKTTTKDLIASILSTKYKVHKTTGNLNNHIGVPITLLSMPEDADIAIIEMGMSNLGEIEILSMIAEPNIAVITNIGESHLEFLKTRENIAKAKLEILKGLKENGNLIALGDEVLLRNQTKEFVGDYQSIWVGMTEDNDVYPMNIQLELNRISFEDNHHEKYQTNLLGTHNVINSLMAIQIAKLLHLTKEDIDKGLSELSLTGMRLEQVQGKNGSTILNDAYNASPTSMKASLNLLASMEDYTRKVAVLGDMLELGEKAKEYHYEIGKLCSTLGINQLITTGSLGHWIREGAMQGGMNEERITYSNDFDHIVTILNNHSNADTIILVKASRGVGLEQIVNKLT